MPKLSFAGERVLAVVAHPDDAELLCAGTLARALGDGAAVGVVVMCRGDKGQPSEKVQNLSAVRRREAEAAATLLGASLFWIGFDDGTLTDGQSERRKVVEIYREFDVTLVLAHCPRDYHPDHRAASAIAEVATWFAASPGQESNGSLLTKPPALWWMDTVNMADFKPGFFVDITDHFEIKSRMLACHNSQLARADDLNFASLTELLDRQATTRGAQAGVHAAEAFQICREFKRARAW